MTDANHLSISELNCAGLTCLTCGRRDIGSDALVRIRAERSGAVLAFHKGCLNDFCKDANRSLSFEKLFSTCKAIFGDDCTTLARLTHMVAVRVDVVAATLADGDCDECGRPCAPTDPMALLIWEPEARVQRVHSSCSRTRDALRAGVLSIAKTCDTSESSSRHPTTRDDVRVKEPSDVVDPARAAAPTATVSSARSLSQAIDVAVAGLESALAAETQREPPLRCVRIPKAAHVQCLLCRFEPCDDRHLLLICAPKLRNLLHVHDGCLRAWMSEGDLSRVPSVARLHGLCKLVFGADVCDERDVSRAISEFVPDVRVGASVRERDAANTVAHAAVILRAAADLLK